jgi:dCMP deaminase
MGEIKDTTNLHKHPKRMNVKIINDGNDTPVAGIVLEGTPFPDYIPPSWDDWFMGMAYDTARKSKDTSTKIGAVIVREKRPILFGYNGFPKKIKETKSRLERPAKYKWTEHGERNAIYCGAKFGIPTDGTVMFTQSVPCTDCARGIIAAGIIKIVVHKQTEALFDNHPQWIGDLVTSREMLAEAGVEIQILDRPLGKWSFVNGKVYIV